MSFFTFTDSKTAIPIAICEDKKKIYIEPLNIDEPQKEEEEQSKIINDILKKIDGLNENEKEILKSYNRQKFKTLNHNKKITLLPNLKGDDESCRTAYFIYGAPGCGKSYLIAEILKNYKKLFPENPIFLFSLKKEDSKLDNIITERFDLDEDFLETELDYTDFKNSLVIMDDIDGAEKKIYKKLNNLIHSILAHGRSSNVSLLLTNHVGANGHETKHALNNSNAIIIYPESNRKQNVYVLKNYIGLTDKTIKRLLKLQCRWICFSKTIPQYYITSHGQAEFLNNLED